MGRVGSDVGRFGSLESSVILHIHSEAPTTGVRVFSAHHPGVQGGSPSRGVRSIAVFLTLPLPRVGSLCAVTAVHPSSI